MLKRLRAFTLLEVVATLAVIAIIAGATVPSLVGYLTRRGVERTAPMLTEFTADLTNMKNFVGYYPFRISHLGSPVATTDTTSCSGVGAATPATIYNSTIWSGPYVHRTIPTTGLVTPIGTIIDTLYRTGNSKTDSKLPLIIRNVRLEDAEDLNSYMEGDADNPDGSNSLGSLTFTAPVNGLVDVTYIAIASTGKQC